MSRVLGPRVLSPLTCLHGRRRTVPDGAQWCFLCESFVDSDTGEAERPPMLQLVHDFTATAGETPDGGPWEHALASGIATAIEAMDGRCWGSHHNETAHRLLRELAQRYRDATHRYQVGA